MALRLGSPKDSDLVARRLGKIAFGLYASPAYRAKLNGGAAPALVGYDEESEFIFEASWLAREFRDRRFTFRSNNQTSQAGALDRMS
jgi:hypothetical protein